MQRQTVPTIHLKITGLSEKAGIANQIEAILSHRERIITLQGAVIIIQVQITQVTLITAGRLIAAVIFATGNFLNYEIN